MTLKIPGYKIVEPIAEGGMASVYLAVQESLGRRVVLKLLKKFTDVYQSARFVNEGRIIASLDHRNIITIHDIDVVGERYYISMEYLEGGDLEHRITEGVNVETALDLVEAIGSCLDFVHRKNVVHRDIKPANILFRGDGTPVLTDFGVAKQQETDSKLTKDGTTLGSPYYISPEQAECKSLDGRADIYSLGIILYEMLTRAKPYKGDSDIQIIIAHLSDPVPSLPPELSHYQELIERMIAKSPDDRFSTAGEMVEYIKSLRQSEPLAATAMRGTGTSHSATDTGFMTRAHTAHGAQPAFQKISEPLLDNKHVLMVGAMTVLFVIALGFINMKILMFSEEEQAVSVTATREAVQPVALPVKEVTESGIVQPAAPQVTDDTKSRHEQYLLKANDARKSLRFATPENDSAYYYYQMVLKEDPSHEEALTGVAEIAEIYADLVEWALGILEHQKAKEYLDTGLGVDPDNARLLELAHRNGFE